MKNVLFTAIIILSFSSCTKNVSIESKGDSDYIYKTESGLWMRLSEKDSEDAIEIEFSNLMSSEVKMKRKYYMMRPCTLASGEVARECVSCKKKDANCEEIFKEKTWEFKNKILNLKSEFKARYREQPCET